MATIHPIKDTRIRVKVSPVLIDVIKKNKSHLTEVPDSVVQSLKALGISISSNASKKAETFKIPGIDVQLLKDVLANNVTDTPPKKVKTKKDKVLDKSMDMYLHLNDLRWLSQALGILRSKSIVDYYLNDLLESCCLELPQNEIVDRNPELEARCQRLRVEEQNRQYRNMTKNVDAVLKHYPEDTIAYQMKAINSQIIAVLQFIFSVAAGFAFGFIGIPLIVGNMDFGLRLLLGIMFALIIALAEIYFLAKKLNEYDNTVDTLNKAVTQTSPSKKKPEGATPQSTKKMHIE